MTKEKYLLEVLNIMIGDSKPIKYKDFNLFVHPKNVKNLLKSEKKYKELGLASSKKIIKTSKGIKFKWDEKTIGISVISIIATITDIFINKRLGFVVEMRGKNAGNIIGAFFQE